MLTDKNAILQVLGTLIKTPILLAEPKYQLDVSDFDNPLAKTIYSSITTLSKQLDIINLVDIDSYLQQFEGQYENFKKQNGIQYIKDCIEISSPENFEYYYNRLRKLSALKRLKKDGFDITHFCDENELDVLKSEQQLKELDTISIDSIFNYYAGAINDIQVKFVCKDDSEQGAMSDGIDELLDEFERNPEIGIPLQGEIYNTLVRGARLKKFYLISGSSGSGKSRQMLGHACTIAYPERFDVKLKKWVKIGNGQKVLFFATEMEKSEMQTMTIAYLSGVNEEKILNNRYDSPEEKIRVRQAAKVMKQYEDNVLFVRMGDPSIGQIKAKIRQNVMRHNINYVFYDYIFSSPGLLAEYRTFNLREDVVLMMCSIALKDLANELNIFIMSGTQLNEKWKDWKGIKDYNIIRGSKAIADKIDVGGISLPVTPEEHQIVDPVAQKLGLDLPTQVQDIYKLRRGRMNHVRIWSYTDLGICRTQDLFVTDVYGNPLTITINEYLFEDGMGSIMNKKEAEEIIEETLEGDNIIPEELNIIAFPKKKDNYEDLI